LEHDLLFDLFEEHQSQSVDASVGSEEVRILPGLIHAFSGLFEFLLRASNIFLLLLDFSEALF
jgi:hypothetical protein